MMPAKYAHQLRSYIAPAAPATRAPCDGTESDLRIEFGFTPRWYHEACGIDFSQQWHLDPLYRRDTVVTMRQELNRRFPSLRLGGECPEETPATIDGIHGALTVAMLFGIGAEYYVDNWPAATHNYLTAQAIAALEPPDLESVPVFAQVVEQMDVIEREFGRVEGYLNWQGVLNNAYRLRGPAILADCVADLELADHLFHIVAQTMIAGMRHVYARQQASGVEIRHATVSNCLVNMVSDETYAERLLPYDRMISEAFDHFGIHNCAWNIDPYAAHYASIENLGYVDMGLDSNLALVKDLCPQARRAVMYKPTDLAGKPREAIQQDLLRIKQELSPCDIVMADIDHGTPDGRVLAFAQMTDKTLAAP
ncbi:MAG: hypothetical protein GWP08_16905 [Nitrospiraceae bacterium]|nr:hypothetical protein [Nitrospiraceae bacterium]